MKSLFTVSALAATALLTSICGSAEAISLTNSSFEDDVTGAFLVGAPQGFTATGTTGTLNYPNYSPTSYTVPVPDGSNVAFLQGGASLTQTLGISFLANTLYSFTTFVGNPTGTGSFSYSIEILADPSGTPTSVASATGPIPGDGLFVSSTATFDTATNSAFNGQTIGIKLTNTSTEQVTFDKLSFEVPFDFSPNLAIGVLGAAWATKKFLAKKAD